MLTIDIHKQWPNLSVQIQHEFSLPIVGIAGASGAGKSTILHMIAGIITPDTGRIILNGQTLYDDRIQTPIAHRNIGYVRQDALLFPHLSVYQNIEFARKHSRTKQKRFSIPDLVKQLSLQNILHRYPQNLSGGEKQKVALVRALIAEPELLLLDEPMASLDDASSQEIVEMLLDYKKIIPMIYVSHHEARMKKLADEVIILQNGCIASLD